MKRKEISKVAEKIRNWPKRNTDRNAMILVTALYSNFGDLKKKTYYLLTYYLSSILRVF